MFIALTEQQELKITSEVQSQIQSFAIAIIDAIPEPPEEIKILVPVKVEPVLTYADKLQIPNVCPICDAKRLAELAVFKKTLKEG